MMNTKEEMLLKEKEGSIRRVLLKQTRRQDNPCSGTELEKSLSTIWYLYSSLFWHFIQLAQSQSTKRWPLCSTAESYMNIKQYQKNHLFLLSTLEEWEGDTNYSVSKGMNFGNKTGHSMEGSAPQRRSFLPWCPRCNIFPQTSFHKAWVSDPRHPNLLLHCYCI